MCKMQGKPTCSGYSNSGTTPLCVILPLCSGHKQVGLWRTTHIVGENEACLTCWCHILSQDACRSRFISTESVGWIWCPSSTRLRAMLILMRTRTTGSTREWGLYQLYGSANGTRGRSICNSIHQRPRLQQTPNYIMCTRGVNLHVAFSLHGRKTEQGHRELCQKNTFSHFIAVLPTLCWIFSLDSRAKFNHKHHFSRFTRARRTRFPIPLAKASKRCQMR